MNAFLVLCVLTGAARTFTKIEASSPYHVITLQFPNLSHDVKHKIATPDMVRNRRSEKKEDDSKYDVNGSGDDFDAEDDLSHSGHGYVTEADRFGSGDGLDSDEYNESREYFFDEGEDGSDRERDNFDTEGTTTDGSRRRDNFDTEGTTTDSSGERDNFDTEGTTTDGSTRGADEDPPIKDVKSSYIIYVFLIFVVVLVTLAVAFDSQLFTGHIAT